MQLRGRVVKKQVATGSKSARDAIVLVCDDAEYVLRRIGGHAFTDSQLDALVGHQIEAEGTLHGYTFLITHWQELT